MADRQTLWGYNPSDFFSDIATTYDTASNYLSGLFSSQEPQREPTIQERANQIDFNSPEVRDAIMRMKAEESTMPMTQEFIEPPAPIELPAPTPINLPDITEDSKLALKMATQLAKNSVGLFSDPPTVTPWKDPCL